MVIESSCLTSALLPPSQRSGQRAQQRLSELSFNRARVERYTLECQRRMHGREGGSRSPKALPMRHLLKCGMNPSFCLGWPEPQEQKLLHCCASLGLPKKKMINLTLLLSGQLCSRLKAVLCDPESWDACLR